MCNRSSSGNPYEGRQGASAMTTTLWAGQSKQQMIRQAYSVGPYTVWFIQRLWDQAGLEVYWQSLEVFQYARWYSAQRVERAVNRAISYGVGGLDGLRFILEQELDRLSEHPDAEASGQLRFPFMRKTNGSPM
jgi:hypothetical protein